MNDELTKLLNQSETMTNLGHELSRGLAEDGTIIGMSVWGIFASIVFSVIGLVYIRYGKKRGPLSTMIYGFILLLFPYFVSDTATMIAIGTIISAMPLFFGFG
ncbi:conserved hypothetical protein [Gammaproteobacteria bacterium]